MVAVQLLMFGATLVAIRKGGTAARFGLLCTIAIIVRCAERLNAYAGSRWEDLATQNYFDTNGVFVLIFVAVPLLLDCVIMLVSFLREASNLLVEVKTRELKGKQKQKTRGGEGGGSGKKATRGKRSKKQD